MQIWQLFIILRQPVAISVSLFQFDKIEYKSQKLTQSGNIHSIFKMP